MRNRRIRLRVSAAVQINERLRLSSDDPDPNQTAADFVVRVPRNLPNEVEDRDQRYTETPSALSAERADRDGTDRLRLMIKSTRKDYMSVVNGFQRRPRSGVTPML